MAIGTEFESGKTTGEEFKLRSNRKPTMDRTQPDPGADFGGIANNPSTPESFASPSHPIALPPPPGYLAVSHLVAHSLSHPNPLKPLSPWISPRAIWACCCSHCCPIWQFRCPTHSPTHSPCCLIWSLAHCPTPIPSIFLKPLGPKSQPIQHPTRTCHHYQWPSSLPSPLTILHPHFPHQIRDTFPAKIHLASQALSFQWSIAQSSFPVFACQLVIQIHQMVHPLFFLLHCSRV